MKPVVLVVFAAIVVGVIISALFDFRDVKFAGSDGSATNFAFSPTNSVGHFEVFNSFCFLFCDLFSK